MYQVFYNNRPAQYPDIAVHPSWNSSKFPSLKEALHYAHHWLGPFACCDIISESNCPNMTPPNRYDYSGYGDVIEIREIK